MSIISSLNNYLLNAYHLLGTILSIQWLMKSTIPILMELTGAMFGNSVCTGGAKKMYMF